MLAEVICAEELLCLVTFAEFVSLQDMVASMVPVWWVGKFVAAVATGVRRPVRAR
jgi:hypothetical protein